MVLNVLQKLVSGRRGMNGVTAQNPAIQAQHFVQENLVEVVHVKDTLLKRNLAMSRSVQVFAASI